MGQIVDGKWIESSIVTSDKSGAYDRKPRTFLDGIGPDHELFQPESGRYHLYVSYACPWAHRALIMRALKGLEDHVSVSVVHPEMLDRGWELRRDFPGATGDHLYGKEYLYEIYVHAQDDVSTSCTVPILWDRKHETIVNNESSEIIRIFNSAFDAVSGNTEDFYPEELREEIDRINHVIYHNVNNGVYRAGFARNQAAYDAAVTALFDTLDTMEQRLHGKKYLVGERLTEADIRFVTTLLRFDLVYFTHFKCNKRMIRDFRNLSRYLAALYGLEAVRGTTHFDHIKRHYYYSHEFINPHRIVPVGPEEYLPLPT